MAPQFDRPEDTFRMLHMPGDTQIDAATLRAYGTAVLCIANADGVIAPAEAEHIGAFLQAYGGESVWKELEQQRPPSDDLLPSLDVALRGKYGTWVRGTFLLTAIQTAKADGEYDSAEEHLFRVAAEHMGLDPDSVGDFADFAF